MFQSFSPQLRSEQPLRNLLMTHSSPAFLLFPFIQRRLFQSWRTSIEHENGFDAVEQQLCNAAQEAKDVSVYETASFFVAHGGLELVDPDAGVDCHYFSFDRFQAWLQEKEKN